MNPVTTISSVTLKAKPFLKWAGGKSQLLSQFQELYPPALKECKINQYVEPFVGGGAVFFDVIQNYSIESAMLYDINWDLVIAYNSIKNDVYALIERLGNLSSDYLNLPEEKRKDFYYKIRIAYNLHRQKIEYKKFSLDWIAQTAYLIFLNRTCFNGLFRLNKSGGFNVPHGKYKNPNILDKNNLIAVSNLLKKVEIYQGDFQSCQQSIDDSTFVYFDPPYRPLNATANFTAYSTFDFNDQEQIRLAKFFSLLNKQYKAKLMLSNSDPKNENINDNFFDDLYGDFQVYRVSANRMINRDATKRGSIQELVITNY